MFWILIKDIRLPLTELPEAATDFAKRKMLSVTDRANIVCASVYKRSVDARRRGNITVVWSVAVGVNALQRRDLLEKSDMQVMADSGLEVEKGSEMMTARPLVVGFGPAGMFAALILAENGYRPIVIERGDDTEERLEAVGRFYSTGKLDTESNIQFGAGGAGTFSDGKLMTRINDSRCRYVLRRFADFGAPEEIMTQAKPHIGTDLLIDTVAGIRDRIRELGGEIHFRTALKSLVCDVTGNVISVTTSNGEMPCGAVILATGHSARDLYTYLGQNGFSMEEKPLSVGVRIEHKRADVENALFGREVMDKAYRDPKFKKLLGSAEYAYSYRENGRGVYTFCMCPGGEVVAGASEEGGVVVNGMSRSKRDGENSNSAICVSITPEECRAFGGTMEFCRALERRAYELGGGSYAAPIETVGDFLSGNKLLSEPSRIVPSYMGGNGNVRLARLDTLFPDNVTDMLRKGIRHFGKIMKGFDAPDAVLSGAETRTSAPYRILRLDDCHAVGHANLYPCGEGAGYAGGITSAAVDGISVSMKIMSRFAPFEKQ